MSDTTIEWTRGNDGSSGKSWNPMRGCSLVSDECAGCYAQSIARRFSGPGKPFEGLINRHGKWNGVMRQAPEHTLYAPLTWREPTRVFVNSMTDLFHENAEEWWIDQIFAVMALCPQHTFIVLTKRAERMHAYCTASDVENRLEPFKWGIIEERVDPLNRRTDDIRATAIDEWPLSNVILGVSVGRRAFLSRIDELRETPAAVRMVSFEPLLEDFRKLSLWEYRAPKLPVGPYRCQAETASGPELSRCDKHPDCLCGGTSVSPAPACPACEDAPGPENQPCLVCGLAASKSVVDVCAQELRECMEEGYGVVVETVDARRLVNIILRKSRNVWRHIADWWHGPRLTDAEHREFTQSIIPQRVGSNPPPPGPPFRNIDRDYGLPSPQQYPPMPGTIVDLGPDEPTPIWPQSGNAGPATLAALTADDLRRIVREEIERALRPPWQSGKMGPG